MNPMKPISHRAWIVCTVLLSGVVWSGHANAQEAIDGNDVDGNDLGSEWIAVPPERLKELWSPERSLCGATAQLARRRAARTAARPRRPGLARAARRAAPPVSGSQAA